MANIRRAKQRSSLSRFKYSGLHERVAVEDMTQLSSRQASGRGSKRARTLAPVPIKQTVRWRGSRKRAQTHETDGRALEDKLIYGTPSRAVLLFLHCSHSLGGRNGQVSPTTRHLSINRAPLAALDIPFL